MKVQYCFHLGREAHLSFAELRAIFDGEIERHGHVAVIHHEPFGNPQSILDQLGGTMKISQLIHGSLEDQLEKQKPEGKIAFGLNVYPQNELFLKKTLKKVKQKMKARGRNVRFLNKKANLNTASIVKGGLLKDGTDFNLVKIDNEMRPTQTIAVQDFAAYSLRDYEKPARLAKEGMLPPKLAQMMINLTAFVTENTKFDGKTLYDPFCGSGTVLGEALIKGMNVIGSDLDPKAIDASEKNLDWIRKQRLCTDDLIQQLFVKDAQTLTKDDLPTPPNMVVTETYLGPPCHLKTPPEIIRQIQRELLPLYTHTFKGLHRLLRQGAALVIAFPVHYINGHPAPIDGLADQLGVLGYKKIHSFTYRRPDQIVGREIMVLERK